jgi:uncharacterized protein (DUF362 family)
LNRCGILYGDNIAKSVQIIVDSFLTNIKLSGKSVLIKPNIVGPFPYTTGATTDPLLVFEIIKYIRKLGAKKVFIAESSHVGTNTDISCTVTGYTKYSKKYNIEIKDIKKEPWIIKTIDSQTRKSLALPQAVTSADFIINVPVLKAHSETILSMGMKNLKGLIPDFEKKKFHATDLHKSLVDLNSLIKPVLTIIDCRLVDIRHEFGGNPIKLNLMFWGNNTVTLDCIAASFLDYKPEKIKYLALACTKNLGYLDYPLKEIEFVNFESNSDLMTIQENVRKQINEFSKKQIDKLKECSVSIIDNNACTGCREAAHFALEKILKENFGNFEILMGKENGCHFFSENVFVIGDCQKKLFTESNIVDGCPPSSKEIYVKLKKWLLTRGTI